MNLSFYVVTHLFGVMLLFVAFGAAALHSATGGTGATNPRRKMVLATHGAALLIIIVTGFGAAAKGFAMVDGFPGWLSAKLVIRLVLGALIAPLNKKPYMGITLWLVLPSLGAVAAWLAITRPF